MAYTRLKNLIFDLIAIPYKYLSIYQEKKQVPLDKPLMV